MTRWEFDPITGTYIEECHKQRKIFCSLVSILKHWSETIVTTEFIVLEFHLVKGKNFKELVMLQN